MDSKVRCHVTKLAAFLLLSLTKLVFYLESLDYTSLNLLNPKLSVKSHRPLLSLIYYTMKHPIWPFRVLVLNITAVYRSLCISSFSPIVKTVTYDCVKPPPEAYTSSENTYLSSLSRNQVLPSQGNRTRSSENLFLFATRLSYPSFLKAIQIASTPYPSRPSSDAKFTKCLNTMCQ